MAFNNSCVCCGATSAFCTAKCNRASLGRSVGVPTKINSTHTHTHIVTDRRVHMHRRDCQRAGGGRDELCESHESGFIY